MTVEVEFFVCLRQICTVSCTNFKISCLAVNTKMSASIVNTKTLNFRAVLFRKVNSSQRMNYKFTHEALGKEKRVYTSMDCFNTRTPHEV